MSVLQDPLLERLLAKLHAESDAQNPAIRDHYDERRSVGRSPEDQAARTKTFLSNKLYALDCDKASSATNSAGLSMPAGSSRSARHMASRRFIWLPPCATTLVLSAARVW
jgi:hypothetical protein